MTGRRVGWYFALFFCFVAAVNAVMITLALRTHSGTVTDHPYERGLAYNRVVEAESKQEMLAWKGVIQYRNGRVHFVVRDKNNTIMAFDKATAAIIRPTLQGMDFTVELKGFDTPVNFPAKGLWEVRVDAVLQGVHYQQSQRIVVE